MLAKQLSIWPKEQDRAIQRAAVALNHADNEVHYMLLGRAADRFGRRPGHFDGAVEIAAELFTPFGRSHSHSGPETEPLGIGRHKGLREDCKLGTLPSSIRCKVV